MMHILMDLHIPNAHLCSSQVITLLLFNEKGTEANKKINPGLV